MSVDMFERRFRTELKKLPPFIPNDTRDARIWRADFPAWRALFSAMCLFGHSTGYRLPSFEDFFRYCKSAYTKQHPDKERFSQYFQDDFLAGMTQRISAWYESGMAETYLYACLVEAIEDKAKAGLVLYDPRADWKLKSDVVVILNKIPLRISAFVGDQIDRPRIEAKRDEIERDRKKNTSESAHWDNAALAAMPVFEIARTNAETQVVNGVRLFTLPAINRLLESLYQKAEIEGWYFPVPEKAQ